MSRIYAEIGHEIYIVEVKSSKLWRKPRMKKEEMAASDIDARLHSQWLEWKSVQKNFESINEGRVAEYQTEKVRKSFKKRPLSCERPKDWTDSMSYFVERRNNSSETLESLIIQFEICFPQMTNRVGIDLFRVLRGDIEPVSSNDDGWFGWLCALPWQYW